MALRPSKGVRLGHACTWPSVFGAARRGSVNLRDLKFTLLEAFFRDFMLEKALEMKSQSPHGTLASTMAPSALPLTSDDPSTLTESLGPT